jgi:hypothetical protein
MALLCYVDLYRPRSNEDLNLLSKRQFPLDSILPQVTYPMSTSEYRFCHEENRMLGRSIYLYLYYGVACGNKFC